jgi:hypothetical protein
MDTELAWAAAFLEGEGSIFIRESGKAKTLTPIVVVNNTDRRLIERYVNAIGGLGSTREWGKKGNLGSKPSIRNVCSFRQAQTVLTMLLPYLTPKTIKYERAVEGLELMNGRSRAVARVPSTVGPELGRVSNFATMGELRHNLVQSMLFGTLENRAIDYIASVDVIRYASIYTAESMEYDLDFGRELWLNRSRWTMLVRQYLDLSETRQFIDRAADIGLGEGKRGVITMMQARNVTRESRRHRWGACVLGFTYRGLRTQQPVLSMHSRVSYVAYIGALDLALAYVLAREIGQRIEVPVEEFQFEWHLGAAQLHAFKSLPLLYSDGWMPYFEREKMRERYPAIKLISRWHDQIVQSTEDGVPLETIKYGPLRRVTRRYREYINEDLLPSVTVDQLGLDPLYR